MWMISTVLASPVEHKLSWDISVNGQPIGSRNLTVKFVPSGGEMLRIMESWTEIEGLVGPVELRYRQRLTAHASNEPASFHTVIDQNGSPSEVQGRYTVNGWWVTVADAGRSRTVDVDVNRIDPPQWTFSIPSHGWRCLVMKKSDCYLQKQGMCGRGCARPRRFRGAC